MYTPTEKGCTKSKTPHYYYYYALACETNTPFQPFYMDWNTYTL